MCSRWGLEGRVAFLDPEFIRAYWRINPELRMPNDTKRMEKYLLRKAFAGLNLLPDEILWRKKEAFSDGVSSEENSWFKILQNHIDSVYNYDLEDYQNIIQFKLNPIPLTNEASYYRKVFISRFGLNRDDIILNTGYQNGIKIKKK